MQENIKETFVNICKIFMSNLSKKTDREKYSRSVPFFTREKIASKITQIWVIYRKASDARLQIKGDRIVSTFYDLFGEIWSSSNATKSIEARLQAAETLKAYADEGNRSTWKNLKRV